MHHNRTSHLQTIAFLICLLSAWQNGQTHGSVSRDALSQIDPLDGMVKEILASYDRVDLVCLGERHGSRQDSDLRLRLIRHPDFAAKVDVIVVEFANAMHQARLDRFIAGENVPIEDVRWIWRDTGYRAWDSPIYEAFLTTVRDVNKTLPEDQRIRVIAGDVPTDWSQIKTWEDMPRVINRGSYPIGVIEEEVFDKGLKGLAIFGSGHCERWGIGFTPALERNHPGRLFVIAPTKDNDTKQRLRNAVRLSDKPQLITIKDSPIAEHRAHDYLYSSDFTDQTKMVDVVDAMAYFGSSPDTRVSPDSAIDEEEEYARERKRRNKIIIDWANHSRNRGNDE